MSRVAFWRERTLECLLTNNLWEGEKKLCLGAITTTTTPTAISPQTTRTRGKPLLLFLFTIILIITCSDNSNKNKCKLQTKLGTLSWSSSSWSSLSSFLFFSPPLCCAYEKEGSLFVVLVALFFFPLEPKSMHHSVFLWDRNHGSNPNLMENWREHEREWREAPKRRERESSLMIMMTWKIVVLLLEELSLSAYSFALLFYFMFYSTQLVSLQSSPGFGLAWPCTLFTATAAILSHHILLFITNNTGSRRQFTCPCPVVSLHFSAQIIWKTRKRRMRNYPFVKLTCCLLFSLCSAMLPALKLWVFKKVCSA